MAYVTANETRFDEMIIRERLAAKARDAKWAAKMGFAWNPRSFSWEAPKAQTGKAQKQTVKTENNTALSLF